jgi:hypothetical protein
MVKINVRYDQSKDNSIASSYKNLVNDTHKLFSRIIQTIDPNVTKIFGNTQFSAQVLLSNNISQSEANDVSKIHNLTAITLDSDCITQLKNVYKIDGDIIIIKTENKIIKDDKSIQSEIDIEYYNPTTKEQLDKSKCKSNSNMIKIPLSLSTKDKELFGKLRQQGIDVFNSHQPAFRTNCAPLTDPITQYDTTLSYRINNYQQNRTDCLDLGCVYDSFSLEGYISCNCSNTNTTNNIYQNDEPSSTSILGCTNQISVIFI